MGYGVRLGAVQKKFTAKRLRSGPQFDLFVTPRAAKAGAKALTSCHLPKWIRWLQTPLPGKRKILANFAWQTLPGKPYTW